VLAQVQAEAAATWRAPTDGSDAVRGSTLIACVRSSVEVRTVRTGEREGGSLRTARDFAERARTANPKYLGTHVDGVWTDNLLALPRF
jgi:hypothetical protein